LLAAGVDILEHFLDLNILPNNFDLEALATCNEADAAEFEESAYLVDRVFGLIARALPDFGEP
jgi:hypothetical protein